MTLCTAVTGPVQALRAAQAWDAVDASGSNRLGPGVPSRGGCASEYDGGCTVPITVRALIPAGAGISGPPAVVPIRPNQALLPVTFYGALSDPEITITQVTNGRGKPAGILGANGSTISTDLIPASFDWEMIRSGLNPYPVDSGGTWNASSYAWVCSNSDPGQARLLFAYVFCVIPGVPGLEFMRENKLLTPRALQALEQLLRDSKTAYMNESAITGGATA